MGTSWVAPPPGEDDDDDDDNDDFHAARAKETTKKLMKMTMIHDLLPGSGIPCHQGHFKVTNWKLCQR